MNETTVENTYNRIWTQLKSPIFFSKCTHMPSKNAKNDDNMGQISITDLLFILNTCIDFESTHHHIISNRRKNF